MKNFKKSEVVKWIILIVGVLVVTSLIFVGLHMNKKDQQSKKLNVVATQEATL